MDMNAHVLALVAAVTMASGTEALAANQFYYTSSPTSWVGGGETVTVGEDNGFTIVASRNYDNGVSFAINDDATNPDFWSQRWWYLDFAAPNNATLTPGEYDNATRWPFQSANEAGLSFSGNGRGNNTLTGSFTVLASEFAQDGSVLSFAADFVQYDETMVDAWNHGSIRYNSSIPIAAVPEPGALWLMGLGLVGLAVVGRRRA